MQAAPAQEPRQACFERAVRITRRPLDLCSLRALTVVEALFIESRKPVAAESREAFWMWVGNSNDGFFVRSTQSRTGQGEGPGRLMKNTSTFSSCQRPRPEAGLIFFD